MLVLIEVNSVLKWITVDRHISFEKSESPSSDDSVVPLIEQ